VTVLLEERANVTASRLNSSEYRLPCLLLTWLYFLWNLTPQSPAVQVYGEASTTPWPGESLISSTENAFALHQHVRLSAHMATVPEVEPISREVAPLMGASSWHYVVPFQTDVATTLAALHQEVFEQEFGSDTAYSTLAELWQDEEYMGECGTHTILDIFRVVDTTKAPSWQSGRDYNTLRPLAPERIRHHFQTDRPSRLQYEALREAQDEHPNRYKFRTGPVDETLEDECQMRWTGLYLVLYHRDEPTDIAIWGYSGD